MAAKYVTALRAFVHLDGARYVPVQVGERLASTHPPVKAHPEQFMPEKATTAPKRRKKAT